MRHHTMAHLPSDVLLMILKDLDSHEMLNVMRVCKAWFSVTEEHRSLWKNLVFPFKQFGWNSSIVELFDRNSHSSLEVVDMQVNFNGTGGKKGAWRRVGSFAEALMNSKRTLKTLKLRHDNQDLSSVLSEIWIHCTNLKDCRIAESPSHMVRLEEERIQAGVGDQDQEQEPKKGSSPTLKILWIHHFNSPSVSDLSLLRNLTSLRVEDPLDPEEWRFILEVPSKSLRHLDISLEDSDDYSARTELTDLVFPTLQVLKLDAWIGEYPRWMMILFSSTLILKSSLLRLIPPVATVWTDDLSAIKSLAKRCPYLSTLKIIKKDICDLEAETHGKHLVTMLRRRNKSMSHPIENLIIPAKSYEAHIVDQLRGLVLNVIDEETVPDFVKVEV